MRAKADYESTTRASYASNSIYFIVTRSFWNIDPLMNGKIRSKCD